VAIVNQIDYGSSPLMPAWRYKLTREEVLGLAVYIRSFATHQPGTSPPVVPSSHLTPRSLYGTFCYVCHDTNGKGIATLRVKDSMLELPDFTATDWQKSRTDADLTHSILEGKGKFMAPMKDKLGTIDVKQMVSLVRGFEGGKQIIPIETPKLEGPPIPLDLSDLLPGIVLGAKTTGMLASPAGNGSLLVASDVGRGKALPPGPDSSAEDAAKLRVGASIFRQFCYVCHGTDGKGELTFKRNLPLNIQLPDFTSELFQKNHTDAQIRVSILDGKGPLMPANRGRVTEEQARDLVPFIRSFAPKSFIPPRPGPDAEFEREYRKLEQQLEELHKQMKNIKDKK
jgi:mono/diheme cytochrome c family protein